MAESDSAYGEYRVTIPHKMHLAIRHLPHVVAYCTAIAQRGVEIGGPGWQLVVQNDPHTRRPRAYIVCSDQEALRRDAKENTLMHIIAALRNYNPAGRENTIPMSVRTTAQATSSQIMGALGSGQ